MPSVRVYVKKRVEISRLTVPQFAMLKLGTVAVAQVIDRTSKALNANDAPAAPLSKYYAIRKSKLHRGNRRNLRFTGAMMNEFKVRTVTDRKANATLSTVKGRIKARANNARELWIAHSPRNRVAIMASAQKIIGELAPRLALTKVLSS